MKRWIAIVALLGPAFTMACSSDGSDACTQGESVRCFCADGEGAQTCKSDGTFGECDCGENSENSNNTNPNNTNPNNTNPNNTNPNNTNPNNTNPNSANNTTPNNTTPNNTDPNNTSSGPGFCKQTCNVGPDCAVFGDPAVWECNDNLCDLRPCTTDAGCVRQMSNFSPGCNSSAQCGIGFACVTIENQNYCAFEPILGFFECDQLQLDEITATLVDSGQPHTVCGAPDALCDQPSGYCYRPCAADADCRPVGDINGLVCMPSGQCGCTEDAHCTISGNICMNGECMCSDQAVCDIISSMAMVPFICAP